jgi:hypothetical protein
VRLAARRSTKFHRLPIAPPWIAGGPRSTLDEQAESDAKGDVMSSVTDTISRFQELDYRESDGIEVSLLWSRIDNSLVVRVVDTRTDERFRLAVRAAEAMEVFRHPFAYGAAA